MENQDLQTSLAPSYVEHNNQRVVTTEQLARFYGCSADNIWDNFRKNFDRFIEGKHYYKITGDELKALKSQPDVFRLPINKFASVIYLWTRRGAARHAKMLTTDKAWEVFEALEDTYFAVIDSLTRKNPFDNIEDLPGEIWADIAGYDGMYQISTKGRVKSFKRGKAILIKQKLNEDGYLHVCLSKGCHHKCFSVNRLVAMAFIPNPENKPEVDHIDNNHTNNCVENLRWATRGENAKYAVESGAYRFGDNHPRAKLTTAQAKEIMEIYIPRSKEYGIKALAKKYGVSRATIENVIYGGAWRHATRAVEKSQ